MYRAVTGRLRSWSSACLAAALLALACKDDGTRSEEEISRRVDTTLALADKGTEEMPALLAALRDREPDVRAAAATAIEVLGPEARTAVPMLVWALRDREVAVRRAVARALAAIGPAALGGAQALIEALADGDPGVRAAAARGLGAIGPAARRAVVDERTAEGELGKLLQDPDPEVQQAACTALEALREEG
jgi:HEAT repeat protein